MTLQMCLNYVVVFSVISVSATTFLSHVPVLKPRCNSQQAWTEGIIALTLITVVVELAVTQHITLHEASHPRRSNCLQRK